MSDKTTTSAGSTEYKMSNQFTPDNSAHVLIDHQVGTLQFVHTMSPDLTLGNAVMLAEAAKAYGMPVVLTTSQEDHVQGPTAPALQQALPEGIQQAHQARWDSQRMGRWKVQRRRARHGS